jgi:hypothetical protein
LITPALAAWVAEARGTRMEMAKPVPKPSRCRLENANRIMVFGDSFLGFQNGIELSAL